MLRGLIISPDWELANRLTQALHELGTVTVARVVEQYLAGEELGRVVRSSSPHLCFISVQDMAKMAETAQALEKEAPGIQLVAISRECDPQVLLDAMRAGLREFLSLPFERQPLQEAVQRMAELLKQRPVQVKATEAIFSFLPSKAGVGASTLALNVSVALSKQPKTNVCLSDFDMNSGMMRFMLKLTNEYSVADACEHALNMDDGLWPQLVTRLGSLDVLHAGKLNPNVRIDGMQIRNLIDFMRRNYQALCFDLSGNLERYSLEIMAESKRIFLVCTPEIPSLHLAREKFHFLKSLDLENRVSVLVNRCQKRQVISNDQIEQILGLPVQMIFPNDYQGVHKSVTLGRWIDFDSDLGRHVHHFAGSLTGHQKPNSVGSPKAARKFLEFFSVTPGRSLSEPKKSA
jgi:pilus assembly protein CpaE